MSFSALEWAERSTAIILVFQANQPKKGRTISSFFMMKQASSRKAKGAMTSSMPWCLAAIRAGPTGRCSSPRTSTLTPAIQRRPNRTNFDHSLMTPTATRCGISRAGDRPTAKITIDR
ncbi:hypothetical protein D3C80_1658510 [compost metagenome]